MKKEELCIIEKLIARIIDKKTNSVSYRVKWYGFDNLSNTWETLTHLINEYCFEPLFEYEYLSSKEKLKLINKYKKMDPELEDTTIEEIEKLDKNKEIEFFRNNFFDFDPKNKEIINNWEYGDLNNDEIDFIQPLEENLDKDGSKIKFLCFWKKREGEERPRKERIYHPKVIQFIDKKEFKKALKILY